MMQDIGMMVSLVVDCVCISCFCCSIVISDVQSYLRKNGCMYLLQMCGNG